jgi:putative peptidoglycan lipid II flippase
LGATEEPTPDPLSSDEPVLQPVVRKSLASSVGLVSGLTAVSRVLGLVRVQLMAFFFGAGMAADAFFVAFRIPNLFRDLFAEGALSTAFVPVFKKAVELEGASRAQVLFQRTFSILFLILSVVTLFGALGASWLVYLAAEGFTADPEKFDLAVKLTRWMFPYLLFVSLASLLMGALNSLGKFGAPAFASSMFNIALIGSMLFLYDTFELPVYSLAFGVVVGGIGQFVIQLPALYRAGYYLRFDFNWKDKGVKAIAGLMIPIIVGLSAGRINILVSSLLASLQGEGAVSYLVYAYQVMHFPLGVFAVAIGTVALPRATEQVARGEIAELSGTLLSSLKLMMFLVMPSMVYLLFFNEDLLRLLYERGAFSPSDTSAVSQALLWYTVGLLAHSAVRSLSPIYYAFSDMKTPMRYSIATVTLNIVLSIALVYEGFADMGFAGLAAATSFAAWLNVALLVRGLRSRGVFGAAGEYLIPLGRVALASALMGLVLHYHPFDFSFAQTGILGKSLKIGLDICLGALVYFGAAWALGASEAQAILSKIKKALH